MNKIIYPLVLLVFSITSCKDHLKHGKAPDDTNVMMALEDADLALEQDLKSEILQDRLWSSEFASWNSGESKLPSQINLINNQELYLRWFDMLSKASKEEHNKAYINWLKTRSPVYWRHITVDEHIGTSSASEDTASGGTHTEGVDVDGVSPK